MTDAGERLISAAHGEFLRANDELSAFARKLLDGLPPADPDRPKTAMMVMAEEPTPRLPDRYGNTKIATVRRDFNDLRKAVRAHDSFAAEEAWERCERWLGLWPLPEKQPKGETE